MMEWLKNRKPRGLYFGPDYVIKDVANLKQQQGYMFDKKERAWPLVHKLLIPTGGSFPYSMVITDEGVVDVFGVLSEEEKKTVGDGKSIAKSSIRMVMHKTQQENETNYQLLILGFATAAIFVIVLLLVLMFLKGKLSIG